MTNINDDSFDMNSLKNSVLDDESDCKSDDNTVDDNNAIYIDKSPLDFTRANYSRDDNESIDNDNTVNTKLNHLNDNSTSILADQIDQVNQSDLTNEIETECLWNYRSGFAYNETQREYEMLRFFLTLGRGRSVVYLSRIYSISTTYIKKVSLKNNWLERIEAYDRQTLSNALSEEDNTRRKVHEEKLEIYRSQQETIANQSADNASKILHLIQRKLDKLVNDTENLTIDELVSTGSLAVKLSQLQKELGSQALAVDALLEAIETDD